MHAPHPLSTRHLTNFTAMHQCLKCKTLYENEEVPIVEGCSCGSRLFLFIKNPTDILRAQRVKKELEQKIEAIDKERKAIAHRSKLRAARRKPKLRTEFGAETIRVHDIGVYSIHLKALMEGAPIIVLSKSGSYIISFPSLFGEKEIELPLK